MKNLKRHYESEANDSTDTGLELMENSFEVLKHNYSGELTKTESHHIPQTRAQITLQYWSNIKKSSPNSHISPKEAIYNDETPSNNDNSNAHIPNTSKKVRSEK